MRRIDGHCDGADRCHGIGQSLLISFGYEPVVSNVRHREFAVIVTGLGVLSEERGRGVEDERPGCGDEALEPSSPLRCTGRCRSTPGRC